MESYQCRPSCRQEGENVKTSVGFVSAYLPTCCRMYFGSDLLSISMFPHATIWLKCQLSQAGSHFQSYCSFSHTFIGAPC